MKAPVKTPAFSHPPVWPWRARQQLSLLPDVTTFLPTILDSLHGARHSIDMEMYLCASGELFEKFLEALARACDRGVTVRLLLDTVGSMGLNPGDRRRLQEAGVEVRFFNPLSFGHRLRALIRDHRKIIIVDGIVAFTGGMCISDEYHADTAGPLTWFDAMARMKGGLVRDWVTLFEQSWQMASLGPVRQVLRWRLGRAQGLAGDLLRECDPPRARLCASGAGRPNPLLVTLIRRIQTARHEVWLNTPYFFPPRALVTVLLRAARRGVTVTLTLPGKNSDHPPLRIAGHYYYERLLQGGVRVLEFQPRFNHLKAARVDDWCTLGSCNYDRWDLNWNMDAGLETLDPDFLRQHRDLQQTVEQDCRTITLTQWRRRGYWHRLRENFWHWIGAHVIRWLRGARA